MTEQDIINAVQPVIDAAAAPLVAAVVYVPVWQALLPLAPGLGRAGWVIIIGATTCRVAAPTYGLDVTVTKT